MATSRRKPSTPRSSQRSRLSAPLRARAIHPTQLGLLAQEFVVIILPPRRLIGPGRSTEHRQPIVGNGAVVFGSAQTYQSRFRASPSRLAANQACSSDVCARTSSRIFQAPRMRGFFQCLEILKRAVIGVHAFVIGNVIAPVAIGRRMNAAKARSHPRPAWRCNRALRSGRRNRPARRHCRRRNCGHRPDRPPHHATMAKTAARSPTPRLALAMTLPTRPYFSASSAPIQKLRSVSLTDLLIRLAGLDRDLLDQAGAHLEDFFRLDGDVARPGRAPRPKADAAGSG